MYETKRLILKILDGEYNHEVAKYYKRNREFLKPWETKRTDMFYTSKFQKIQLNKDLKDIEDGKLLRFWIFKKSKDMKLIGNIGLTNIIRGDFLSGHLGYRLDKDEINEGYMTEVTEKIIEIIFNEYKLHRIETNIMLKNKASIRLLEKLNFSQEGVCKKYLRVDGKWEDHLRMVLLNDDII